MPSGQGSTFGEVKQNKGPRFAVFNDAAEALYQVYCTALDYKGPRGVPLKLWHELANVERRAWRFVLEQVKIQVKAQDILLMRRPGPNQIAIATCSELSWAGRVVDLTSIKSITDLRKLLHDMDEQLAAQDAEIRPPEVHHG